jgi:hypothetical protein
MTKEFPMTQFQKPNRKATVLFGIWACSLFGHSDLVIGHFLKA